MRTRKQRQAKTPMTPIEKEVRRIKRRRENYAKQLRQVEDHVREVWQPKVDALKRKIAGDTELLAKLET